jgi:SAM-dependent methyltransferase
MTNDVTQRFSNRVDDYARYRPEYPVAMFDWLCNTFGISANWRVADIGAGTGISTRQWLDRGHRVVAVEPNTAMREAAIRALGDREMFRATAGTAEATMIAAHSVDLISAAQSFHWFDRAAVRHEWRRILRANGLVAVYWNSRLTHGTRFLEEFEALQHEFGTDYAAVAERHPTDAAMQEWFGAGFLGMNHLRNVQVLDFDQLRGRLLSSSWAPLANHPRHAPMISALKSLFERHQARGHIELAYDTRIFVGILQEP